MSSPTGTGVFSPKVTIYYPDGHGRDSYVYGNNGGLSRLGYKIVTSGDQYGPYNFTRVYNLKYVTNSFFT